MPFPIVGDTGLIITLSPTIYSYLDQIFTFTGIPNNLHLGMITTTLLLLCCWQLFRKQKQGVALINPEDDDNLLEKIPTWTALEITITILAAVTLLVSIATILISPSRVVLITGVIGFLVPPYSAFQEQKVTECEDMKERLETREQEMNNLKNENERLNKVMSDYEKCKINLEHLPNIFEDIRKMECASLNLLEEQLEQSQQILEEMKNNKLDIILNNVFDALIACDKDGDVKLTDDEIDDLIHGIEGINKVDINDELSKRMIIDAGRDINAVMKLVKDVLDDNPNTGAYDRDKLIRFL